MNPLLLGTLLGAGSGILGGAMQDKSAKEAVKQQNKMNAIQNRYAPLFNQAPVAMQAAPQSRTVSSALSGAMGGLQTGMNYKMMDDALAKAATTPTGSTGNDLAMNTRRQDPYGQRTAGVWIGNPSDYDEPTNQRMSEVYG